MGMTIKRMSSLASTVSKNGAGYARLHDYCIPTSPINIILIIIIAKKENGG